MIGTNEDFNVTVTVHNTGLMDGKEVIQVSLDSKKSSAFLSRRFVCPRNSFT